MTRKPDPLAPAERPVYEGVCNVCGQPLRREGDKLVCTDRPRCKGERPLPLHLVLDASGVERLPGF